MLCLKGITNVFFVNCEVIDGDVGLMNPCLHSDYLLGYLVSYGNILTKALRAVFSDFTMYCSFFCSKDYT